MASRHLVLDRVCRMRLAGDKEIDREAQRHPGAGNRGSAGAAIGLDDVAVDDDLPLAQLLHVDDSAQASPDKTLNFLCSSRLLALRRLAGTAGVGETGRGSGRERGCQYV